MINTTENNKNKVTDLLFNWLVGAGFSGFQFGTEFSLFFDKNSVNQYHGNDLPCQLELHILSEWWFGSLENWKQDVNSRGVGVEPCEPVQAFELAKLRWSEGSSVNTIDLSDEALIITFENNTVLVISLKVDDEYAFSLAEKGVAEENAKQLFFTFNLRFGQKNGPVFFIMNKRVEKSPLQNCQTFVFKTFDER